MLYISIFIPLFSFSIMALYNRRIGYYIGLFTSIILFFIAALRYGVGTDFFSYQTIWNAIEPLKMGSSRLEKGFLLSCAALKYISESDLLFFSFYAFITLFFFIAGLKKLNYNLCIGIFYYFCLFYFAYLFNGMRQAVALSFFIFSLKHLFLKKYIQYIIINIIGYFFHTSGIFYILIIPLIFLKKNLYLLTFLSLLICFLGYKLNIFMGLLESIARLLGKPNVIRGYARVFTEPTSLVQILSRVYLFIYIFFLAMMFRRNSIILFCYYTILFSFCMYILLFDINMLSTRINMTFRILEIIVVLEAIKISRRKGNKFLFFLLLILPYILQFYVNITIKDNYYSLRQLF